MPLPGLSEPPSEAGGTGGDGGRPVHLAGYGVAGRRGAGLLQQPDPDGDAAAHRRTDLEGDPLPVGLFAVRGPQLPDPVPLQRHPVRRREPAYPAGHADRQQLDGSAVYSGRALHRPAPAGQRQAAGHPLPPAGSGQHPHCGGARRGHHAGRRLSHRHRPRRRGPRRTGGGRRYAGGGHGQSRQSDGPVSQWEKAHRGAGCPPSRQREISDGAGRTGE